VSRCRDTMTSGAGGNKDATVEREEGKEGAITQ
jgi:hypothetical protein